MSGFKTMKSAGLSGLIEPHLSSLLIERAGTYDAIIIASSGVTTFQSTRFFTACFNNKILPAKLSPSFKRAMPSFT